MQVHAVRLRKGRAYYSNRYVQTNRLKRELQLGWSLFMKIGDLKGMGGLVAILLGGCKKWLGLLTHPGRSMETEGAGTGNTALAFHARRLLALHEGRRRKRKRERGKEVFSVCIRSRCLCRCLFKLELLLLFY